MIIILRNGLEVQSDGRQSNFKKQNQKGQGLKKHKWIPLVVIVVLALVLILIQYFMIDILMAVNTK